MPKPSTDIPNDEPKAQVASQVSPSVVQVNVRTVQATPFGLQEGKGVGSGVIYRKDGYIITNAHVVEDSNQVNLAFADGSTEQGNVVGKDETTFWLVERLAEQGRIEEAQTVFDRALSTSNDLGLFSEMYHTEKVEMLGNFPQGLTHLAHISAARALAEHQAPF